MPAKNPRVSVSLEPQDFEVIKRLAELQGRSMSQVLADLVVSIREPLWRTVSLLDAAREAPKEVYEGLRQAALRAELDLSDGLNEAQRVLLDLLRLVRESGDNPPILTGGSGGLDSPPEGDKEE